MKIRQSYRLALSIFTVTTALAFVAQADALSNDQTVLSKSVEALRKRMTGELSETFQGETYHQIARNPQIQISETVFVCEDDDGGLICAFEDYSGSIPPMLVGLKGRNKFKTNINGGEEPTKQDINKKPSPPRDKPLNRPNVKRPGARIWDDNEYGGWQRWFNFNAVAQEGTALKDIPEGISDWGKEALRRIRDYGPGYLPPEGWEPGKERSPEPEPLPNPVGNQLRQLEDGLGDISVPKSMEHPPVIQILDYPKPLGNLEYYPHIGLEKTLLLPPQKNLPALEIGYMPFSTDAPATIGGPEDAKRVMLILSVATFMAAALKAIPQLVEAVAAGLPIFMIMPEDDGMLIIQGRKGEPSPRT